ncbi:hypothetical protein GCM10010341_14730 [Streptomyces noursei]|nr:hypothetical protein GCM10010341_14730 [Streptomyces noursei]
MASHVCALAAKLGLLHRVVIVHVDLADVEWGGTRKLAEDQARQRRRRRKPAMRAATPPRRRSPRPGLHPQLDGTSDLKRGPIRKLMTRLVAELGDLGRPARILNCMGQRAAESAPRAKLTPVRSTARRATASGT